MCTTASNPLNAQEFIIKEEKRPQRKEEKVNTDDKKRDDQL